MEEKKIIVGIKMKTFWCVKRKLFDSGVIKTLVCEVKADEKPQNGMVENKMCDEYRDYFDTYEEAKEFERETQNA